jgi:hypothetical protein
MLLIVTIRIVNVCINDNSEKNELIPAIVV